MPHQHTHLLAFPYLSHIGEYASTPRVRLNLAGHTRVVTRHGQNESELNDSFQSLH